jgi:hypothetical protein
LYVWCHALLFLLDTLHQPPSSSIPSSEHLHGSLYDRTILPELFMAINFWLKCHLLQNRVLQIPNPPSTLKILSSYPSCFMILTLLTHHVVNLECWLLQMESHLGD